MTSKQKKKKKNMLMFQGTTCFHNQSNTNSLQWLHSPCSLVVCPDCWDYAVYPGYVQWMLSTYGIHGAASLRNTPNTLGFCCKGINFLLNTHNRHLIAHPLGWAIRWLLWVPSMMFILPMKLSWNIWSFCNKTQIPCYCGEFQVLYIPIMSRAFFS